MGALFGKTKPKSQITDQDRAVLQMKKQRDKVKQYQIQVSQRLENDKRLAKALVDAGRKDRALLILRKKRIAEQLLLKTDNQLNTIENLIQDVEFAQVESQVLNILKQGNEALKTINDTMNIEEIEMIMEETAEAAQKQEEISRIISGETLTTYDMDAIEKEYNDLISETQEKESNELKQKSEDDSLSVSELKLPDVVEDEPYREDVKVKEKKKERVALEAS